MILLAKNARKLGEVQVKNNHQLYFQCTYLFCSPQSVPADIPFAETLVQNQCLIQEEKIPFLSSQSAVMSCPWSHNFSEHLLAEFHAVFGPNQPNQRELPLLRKDFIVDEYQIYQSRFYGADCILLIASFLSDAQLKEFYEIAKELSLDVLIEVHDKSEMDRALKLEFPLIGINNRDLKTFKVNLETTINLSKGLQDKIIVSESGIKTKEDVKEIMSSGTKTFLVGESFMRASDPGEELQKLFFS